MSEPDDDSPDSPSCASCRFWFRDTDHSGVPVGQCRRGLRHVQITATKFAALQLVDTWDWPMHYGDDWCGEWQAKPK